MDVLVVDERRDKLVEWLGASTPFGNCPLEVASADASFRRYFRIHTTDGPRVVMDSPPQLEPCGPFIRLAQQLGQAGIKVPEVHHMDAELGFLVLSDFGDLHYQDALQTEQQNKLYERAIEVIIQLQKLPAPLITSLPVFDQAWQAKELEIFRDWCLPGISKAEFRQYTAPLIEGVDAIPKSFMHRDFHCRNLLVLEDETPGIIDFQGAMLGPITYDLVSLLRDCYLSNSPEWTARQVGAFRTQLIQAGLLEPETPPETFLRWFDWAGLQRHLKCVGIFHRLKFRDNKPEYLEDVPRVLGYVKEVLRAHPELSDLQALVEQADLLGPEQ